MPREAPLFRVAVGVFAIDDDVGFQVDGIALEVGEGIVEVVEHREVFVAER